jgi:hypothetical protein
VSRTATGLQLEVVKVQAQFKSTTSKIHPGRSGVPSQSCLHPKGAQGKAVKPSLVPSKPEGPRKVNFKFKLNLRSYLKNTVGSGFVWAPAGMEVLVVTPDRDLLPLQDHVFC